MSVFADLETRVGNPPFDRAAYERQLPACRDVAQRAPLVHVSGKGRPFDATVTALSQELPTSEDTAYYTDDTRDAEDLLGLPRSAYFYAGRAHPAFGNVALAFAPECEKNHQGSATPFDTGGLVHPKRHLKIRLDPSDGQAERVQYGKSSEIALAGWRDVFAQVLAAYFSSIVDYWQGKPLPCDPEGLYELNDDWRAWTFEVRFEEAQSVLDRAAWCADEMVMNSLRRLQAEEDVAVPGDPPSPLEQFLRGPAALEPAGTPRFCASMDQWVREQVRA